MKLLKKMVAFMLVIVVTGVMVAAPSVAKAGGEVDIKLSADVTETWVNNEPGSYANELQVLALMHEATDVTRVCGIAITFKNPDLTNAISGQVVFGGPTNNWWNTDLNSTQAFEFGDKDKRVNMVKIEGTDDYKITFLNTAPIFPSNETMGQAVIRQYNGAALVVSCIELLDADGTVLARAGKVSVPAQAPSPTPDPTSAPEPTNTPDNPPTGVSSIAITVCGIAVLLCAAAVIASKKKAN